MSETRFPTNRSGIVYKLFKILNKYTLLQNNVIKSN